MRKRILAIGLTLAMLMTAVVWFMQPHVALASDNRGEHLCQNDGSGQCLDLKDDLFQTDQEIYWFNNQRGNGLGWNLAVQGTVQPFSPFHDTQWDNRYLGDDYYQIEKTTATGHDGCIGLIAFTLVWLPCGDSSTLWVVSSFNFLVNIDITNLNDKPGLAGAGENSNGTCNTGNGAVALIQFLGSPCGVEFTGL
jgi:hypothetical protein